jgi:hypothetical protein
VPGKFWIVEKDGSKVATIQTSRLGTPVVVTSDQTRVSYPTIDVLKKQYGVKFEKPPKREAPKEENSVNGFPTANHPYNKLFHLETRVPVYTETEKSKSFICAGYYLIKRGEKFVGEFCPKLLHIKRKQFIGPFATEKEMQDYGKK